MADLSIVKIKIRRGSNSDRLRVILDEGEMGYATDIQRLFVGDGNTLGGINIANKFLGYGVRNTFGAALVGDTVYDTVEKNIFALSSLPPSLSGNWVNVGPKTDDTYIYYNSAYKLEIVPDSVDRTKLKATDIVYQALTATSDRRISVLFDGNTIKLNPSNRLYVDTFVVSLSSLKYGGTGLDCTGLKFSNLPILYGTSSVIPGDPNYDLIPDSGVFILNEPVGSTVFYLMIKV